MGLLDGDLKETIGAALDSFMLDITVGVVVAGTYNPVTDASTGASTTSVAARGFIESYTDAERDRSQGLIEREDRKAVIMARSLNGTVPKVKDTLTFGGATYRILAVDSDPATATYTLHCRR